MTHSSHSALLRSYSRVSSLGRCLCTIAAFILTQGASNATAQTTDDSCAQGLDIGQVRLSIGGQYRLMANGANMAFHDRTGSRDQDEMSVANQRLRTWINIHDQESCRYGVYMQAEIGHLVLGDGFEFPKTFASGGDTAGVELRRGYLWYKPTETSLLRAGVVGWEDRFGERQTFTDPLWSVDRYDSSQSPLANSVWDFNVGGVVFEDNPTGKWHYSLATLLLQRGEQNVGGDGGTVLLTADLDRDVGSALWGASAYYLRDRGGYSYGAFGGPQGLTGDSWDLWLGGRGHFATGTADNSVFLIMNTGRANRGRWEHTGWAAKWALTFPLRVGAVRWQTLYSTGDDGSDRDRSSEFRTVAQSVRNNLGAQSYWSLLGITSPRGPSDVNDLGIGLQNGGLGLLTLQGGWEQPIAEAVSLYVAAGWLRSDEPSRTRQSTTIGTELLAEVGWQMAGVLGLTAGAGWLFSGDFFRDGLDGAPTRDLFEVYARWQLEF